MAREIADSHHDRWDGTGYPDGLKGESIPLAARIVAIADVYDALASKRVYKDAISHEECVEEIRRGAGSQFDPWLVDVFLSIQTQFREVAERFSDGGGAGRKLDDIQVELLDSLFSTSNGVTPSSETIESRFEEDDESFECRRHQPDNQNRRFRQLDRRTERWLELMLIVITLGIASLLVYADNSQILVLNLFYLPVVLGGFFLGQYRSGVTAFFSVLMATIVVSSDLTRFAMLQSPVTVALSMMTWGATLGLTALLVGALSEQCEARALEAHEAQVGVVEVLARYLRSADPELHRRAQRVVELSEQVAVRMRLTPKEIDDMRIAAMLLDVENIEITARVIRKAVGNLQGDEAETDSHQTFHGTELVKSLGRVLSGAFPLVLSEAHSESRAEALSMPLAARILHTVRAYCELTESGWARDARSPAEATRELLEDSESGHDTSVVLMLRELVCKDQDGAPVAMPATTGDATDPEFVMVPDA
ncbi:Probable cyclic di-GMP phosphodiesterase VC_1348 [Durusdinium trenchii]|uniref:Probable cyclic di-GMP phosphodiesterase VC_1348 n=1 Tax=Durusdinium trenchii TaxID=1381693 RepID=A0ABP0MBU4_9DINO